MFDDPKKDLKWLEQQLLAEDAPREDPPDEEFLGEEDWLDAELRQAHALLGDTPAATRSRGDVFAFLEEDTAREESAVYADIPSPAKPQKSKKKKKEKGIGGLVFLACLETLGIIAVLLWWVIWLL